MKAEKIENTNPEETVIALPAKPKEPWKMGVIVGLLSVPLGTAFGYVSFKLIGKPLFGPKYDKLSEEVIDTAVTGGVIGSMLGYFMADADQKHYKTKVEKAKLENEVKTLKTENKALKADKSFTRELLDEKIQAVKENSGLTK